jgi:glycosyltransferase involved in cell wall biosynthesis
MNILFYSPFNLRSRDTESLMLAFKKQGHEVSSLTQGTGNIIHSYLRDKGIKTYSHFLPGKQNAWYYFRQVIFLIKFCRKHRIAIVYSHLESANFVASIAQYFFRASVYICRHHIDEAALYGFDKSLAYKITYRFAKKIIVVSDQAKAYMTEHEKIKPEKIIHINLAYDFSLYKQPDANAVKLIRSQTSSSVILLTACRLTKHKRPHLAVHTLDKLLKKGMDAHLIIVGSGEEEKNLKDLIAELKLTNRVTMPGYVSNMPDYLAAADFLVHPSVLESSCVIVKESGLVNTPVIVCRGIGDFDSYLRQGVNGFLVDRGIFAEEAADLIEKNISNTSFLKAMGASLHQTILNNFEINRILPAYNKLNNVE